MLMRPMAPRRIAMTETQVLRQLPLTKAVVSYLATGKVKGRHARDPIKLTVAQPHLHKFRS